MGKKSHKRKRKKSSSSSEEDEKVYILSLLFVEMSFGSEMFWCFITVILKLHIARSELSRK